MKKAANCIGFDSDAIVIKIYKEFANSAKRFGKLNEFFNALTLNGQNYVGVGN